MKKTELYLQHHRIENAESHIWDRWVDYKLEQQSVNRREDDWDKVGAIINEIPNIYDWTIEDGQMCFRWISEENGEEQEELVPLSEFVDDLDEQPDLEMLWHCNYYDGPLSGVARYEGELVWFDNEEYGDWGEDAVRSYQLYRLKGEVMDELFRQHHLFNEMVGYHSNHHPDFHNDFVGKNKEEFDEFYKMAKEFPKLDLEKGEKLGGFAYHQFKYYARPR